MGLDDFVSNDGSMISDFALKGSPSPISTWVARHVEDLDGKLVSIPHDPHTDKVKLTCWNAFVMVLRGGTLVYPVGIFESAIVPGEGEGMQLIEPFSLTLLDQGMERINDHERPLEIDMVEALYYEGPVGDYGDDNSDYDNEDYGGDDTSADSADDEEFLAVAPHSSRPRAAARSINDDALSMPAHFNDPRHVLIPFHSEHEGEYVLEEGDALIIIFLHNPTLQLPLYPVIKALSNFD